MDTDYHLLHRQDVQYAREGDRLLKFVVFIFLVAAMFYWYLYLLPLNNSRFHRPSSLASHESQIDSLIASWNATRPFCSTPANVDEMVNNKFISKFVKDVSLKCNQTTIYTELDWQSGLVTLKQDEDDGDDVSCYYSFFWRSFEADNYIDYSGIDPFPKDGVQMTQHNDLMNVSCYKQDEKVYLNTHMWIPDLKPKVEKDHRGHNSPNVLVLFLESLSTLSFKRFMPLTEQALNDLGHVQQLKGFVKHNDNSFPNTISFLTGERIDWDDEKKRFKGTAMDDVTPPVKYLWDDFDQSGYVSGFLEDMAVVGIFNYAKWGWRTPPTTWYPRAFWVQMYPERGDFKIWDSMNVHEQWCFSGVPKVDIFLDQVLHFIQKMNSNKQPYFLFAFHSQVTHDDINNYKIVDPSFAKFFQDSKKYLDDTLLIFAGDHGPRYGSPSVKSAYGRLEERMNLVTIRVPESLNLKFPHLRKFLTANHDRLTSWLDVHQLVKDVAINNYDLQDPPIVKSGPVSPWRQLVHPDRTCDDAIVYEAYCVCNGSINTDLRDEEFYDTYWAKDAIQKYINKLGKKFKNQFPNCDFDQKVNKTMAMNYIIPPLGDQWMKDDINITSHLLPSEADINVHVQVVHHKNRFSVVEKDGQDETIAKLICK